MSILLLRRSLSHSFVRRLFSVGTVEARLHLYSRSCNQTLLPLLTSCQLPLRKFSSTSRYVSSENLSLQIEEGGQELNLLWNEKKDNVSLYAVWLRHNCQCPECLADNGQCLVVPQLLDPFITVDSADISGKVILKISTMIYILIIILDQSINDLHTDYHIRWSVQCLLNTCVSCLHFLYYLWYWSTLIRLVHHLYIVYIAFTQCTWILPVLWLYSG